MDMQAQRSLLSLSDYESYSGWFNRCYNWLKRLRFFIVIFWACLTLWGAATGFGYIASAKDEMKAPDGSQGALDDARFNKLFFAEANMVQSVVFIKCLTAGCKVGCPAAACTKKKQCPHGVNPEIGNFTKRLTKEIRAYSDKHELQLYNDILGYYSMEGTKLDELKCQLVSSAGDSTFISFQSSRQVKSDIRYAFVEEMLERILPRLNPDPSKYQIGYTGIDPVVRDGSGAAVKQSEKIDAIIMPFAFALLAVMVRSWRLLLLSLINMGIAFLVSFGVLNMLTNIIQKPPLTTTATLVEVLVLGFSVDYSLFLLRRYRDECKAGRHPEIAAKIMLAQAGHSVLMSSLTIICIFAGFIFLRSTDLMVQGMACVVGVACCLLVNMTNTPAMLFIFPHFFSTFTQANSKRPCCNTTCLRRDGGDVFSSGSGNGNELSSSGSESHDNDASDILLENDFSPSSQEGVFLHHLTSPSARVNKTRGGLYKGWYYRVICKITEWPYNLLTLFLLYLLIVPIAYQVLHVRRNSNLLYAIPRSSQAASTYAELFKAFPGGTLQPMYVMVEAPEGVLSEEYGPRLFEEIVSLTKEIAVKTNISVDSMNSIALANGVEIGTKHSKIPFALVKTLLKPDGLICKGISLLGESFCDLYTFVWKQMVNPEQTATLITITVPFSPFANRIESFVTTVNKILDERDPGRSRLHLCGAVVGFVEDMRISFGEFPLLIVITCVVVFSLLGVMLQSVFVVIRLTLTVVLPLAAVFGLAVLVYQDGILDWTGLAQVKSNPDGFYWYIPLLTFTMCIGLALDYDVFVISRIREHRYNGRSIRAAILKAVWEINSTVVAAGLIMALAFGGLLLCDSIAVNQMSWILTTSVLFDTFVVQMIAVPAIMSLADNLSWWPYPVPKNNLISLEEEIKMHNDDIRANQPLTIQ